MIISLSSCKKPVEGDGKLKFSENSVKFDTVFTSIGSTYRTFKVYNPYDYLVKTDILLAGGQHSFFSINVDGLAGTAFRDIEILPKDSIFIFVKVTINPHNQDNPYLIEDSILFKTGKYTQHVNLLAYGQDANFIVGDTYLDPESNIKYKIVAGENETKRWTKDRPYVIYGWAVVDEGGKLIIEEGTRVYLHHQARLWVYAGGNIEVNGTKEEPVTFQGDAELNSFDLSYAKWDRILISEGMKDNKINYAIISNAFVGIQVEPLEQGTISPNKTIITNTIVKNTQNAAIIGKRSRMFVENCVLANNGGGSAVFAIGDFTMQHTSISNHYNNYPNRKIPALYVANTIKENQVQLIGHTSFNGVNNIVSGALTNEFAVEKNEGATLDCKIKNCLIRLTDVENNNIQYTNTVFKSDTLLLFRDLGIKDIKKLDLQLKNNAPAIGMGLSGISSTGLDLNGNSWANPPSVGAYEYIP
jgi:hypothetical protein